MGGITSKTQQDLKFYLERDYDISNYPCIIHKNSKKPALVHQITTDSTEQAHRIRADVNLYNHLHCQSISKILEYIPLESDKICSDQEYHYIVEEDMQKYNLKEQFFARKYYKQHFSDHQIMAVIKTLLCALNVYHSQFKRKFHNLIKLDLITIDDKHNNHLRVTDPLLIREGLIHGSLQSDNSSEHSSLQHILPDSEIRESPERIQIRKTRFNENRIQHNQLLADLYTVGILVLQLHRMKLFEKNDTKDVLSREIQSISNREIKSLVTMLTSHTPEQRGRVYDIVKLQIHEEYCLEKNLKNGKQQKEAFGNQFNQTNNFTYSQNSYLQAPLIKKQTSFSFGTSQYPIYNPITKPSESITFEMDNSLPISSFQRQKAQTLSNMSTDRTTYQPKPIQLNTTPSKPVVKFTSGFSTISTPSLTTMPIFSTSLPNLKDYNSTRPHYIPSTYNPSLLPISKELQKNRTDSFLINDDKKPMFKEPDYSPFKKQQDLSPLITKYQVDENSYKKIFDKYAHINYQTSPYSPSTFSCIKLEKAAEQKKIQQQIHRLLKHPSNQQPTTISNLSPIAKQLKNDSPINALEGKTAFAKIQSTSSNRTQINNLNDNAVNEDKEDLPVYRPNKEVQEILKRLGIGSLLYGNSQNGNKQQEQKASQTKPQPTQNPPQNQSNNSQPQIFIHKGTYNITPTPKQPVKPQNPPSEPDDLDTYSDIHNRETTPIRPVQKAKYNSTIVQVGDEDSQYSSSGVRNGEAVDLTDHQYVVEEYETGSKYEGYKLNGERDGHGKFFYQDGGYYEGQWKCNKMDGWGKLFYEGGKLAYEGNWCQDQFHGFGKVYNDNPLKLDCGFDFTNFDLLQDYWEYYEGMLVKDTKEGRGKIKLTNGEFFQGDFHNDRIQGFGKFFMKEGTMIEGIWRDSKLIKIISS